MTQLPYDLPLFQALAQCYAAPQGEPKGVGRPAENDFILPFRIRKEKPWHLPAGYKLTAAASVGR
ncbi:hypothetical protein MUN84_18815 [Hymenobacter sp. 5516J-16]|uniref:hypothetical protein n=1 Tax=Hymenobacter sp. 5516J-16 TaxID=2932253 RepID=UPI001FCFB926|nr:hypothetical protein [Hymenobacter sp. 5516J-16]UOQ76563.1 hypothetical protein MUN84_18815 [Hymenobacter sp. 5516J-16]